MGTPEFIQNWDALALRLEESLGLPVSRKANPLVGWMVSGKNNYLNGEKLIGCAQTAYAQFALEDLEQLKTCDGNLYTYFRKELRRNLPSDNYFGVRQELRLASALLSKGVRVDKSENPDFVLRDISSIGFECTSCHLALNSRRDKSDVTYKVTSAISRKSMHIYSTQFSILAVDTSNLLFHEGLGQKFSVLSRKTELSGAIQESVNTSPFQSVLTFGYAWVPTGVEHGATLTSYYTRIDRHGIIPSCQEFLDHYYPMGDVWVMGHIQQRV